MWHGTMNITHHGRTIFEDCEHGSEMQFSHILLNLHMAVRTEGHLPEEWAIGADNTTKETKNQTVFSGIAWLLCMLEDTPHLLIDEMFLVAGHTHDALASVVSLL